MHRRNKLKKTIYACFIGYVVQAIINNFAPLLFLTFQHTYGSSLSKITMLVTVNFGLQLVVDLLAAVLFPVLLLIGIAGGTKWLKKPVVNGPL